MKIMLLAASILLIVSAVECNTLSTNFEANDYQKDYEELCNNQSVFLNFANVEINSIGNEFISSSVVTCLTLRNIENTQISSSAFDKLPNLTFLDLSENKWDTQQFMHESGNEKLKILVIDNVFYYRNMQWRINGEFPALEKLYLRNNNLQVLSGGPRANISKLTHLYLNDNTILRIYFYERENDNYNSDNNFDWLPKGLKHLDLKNNELESLSLLNMYDLEFLSVENNKLKTVHLDYLIELKHLNLSNNEIESISVNALHNLPKLEYLNLANNKITYFSGKIVDNMPMLKNLTLDCNYLTDAPEIQQAPSLKMFSLTCNSIKKLTSRNFNGMSQLEVLLLDNNEIAEIEPDTFNQLENLEVLQLGRNQLTTLPEEWMMQLQNLRFLHLEENKFTNLEALQLSDSPTLTTLFLQNNPLKYIRAHSLDAVPENVTIEIDSTLVTVDKCLCLDEV